MENENQMTESPETSPSEQPGFAQRWLWGHFSLLVLILSLVGLILDQALKLWLLHGYELGLKGSVPIVPTIDFVLVWNYGISYGLFQQGSDLGRWLLAGFTVLAAVGLWIWAVRSTHKILAVGLGLVIGGALGNGVDRFAYGAVVDYVHFHVGDFSWYVFNLADVWIVVGVGILLLDSFFTRPISAAK